MKIRILVLFLLLAGLAGAAANAQPAASAARSCAGVSEIPKEECEALVSLYPSTHNISADVLVPIPLHPLIVKPGI